MFTWNRIEEIAKKRGYKHGWKTDLANKTGITIAQLYEYRKRNRLPRVDVIIKLAQYLGVTPNDLLLDDNTVSPPPTPTNIIDIKTARIKNALGNMTDGTADTVVDTAEAVAKTDRGKQNESARASNTVAKSYSNEYPNHNFKQTDDNSA